MYKAIWHKFVTHRDLAELLMATGTARLVRHTFQDSYWCDGGDGTGENRFGTILERVRGQLFVRYGRTPVQAASKAPINRPIQTKLQETIIFSSGGGPFHELASHFERVVAIDGKEWPTLVHYFEANKFPDHPDLQERIRLLPMSADPYQCSLKYNQYKRRDWEQGVSGAGGWG